MSKTNRRIKPSETLSRSADKTARQVEKEMQRSWLRRLLSIVAKPLQPIFRPLRWLLKHLIPRYFLNAFNELRAVTWPRRRESRQLTSAVILFAIVFGFFISGLDIGLDKVFKKVFLKE